MNNSLPENEQISPVPPGESSPAAHEDQFRLLVEGVRDYAIFLLDTEGRVVTWNAGAQRFNGYHADEIIGKHFSCFYTASDIAACHPWRELEIATAEGRYEEEGWRVRKDGSHFWAHVVITALRDQAGVLRGFGKVTRDITERREREREHFAALLTEQQRRFLRDVLASVTQGKLILCSDRVELPPTEGEAAGPPVALAPETLRLLRKQAREMAMVCGLPEDRIQSYVTGVSEAAMNAVVHAGGGEGRVYGDTAAGIVRVFVEDKGGGIDLASLPQATLERGYSTGGNGFGHGFWLMLQMCDQIYLLTGTEGTTVVLEQKRIAPPPAWLQTALAAAE